VRMSGTVFALLTRLVLSCTGDRKSVSTEVRPNSMWKVAATRHRVPRSDHRALREALESPREAL
jgi:hypothetical protein